jgi:hypothetical protein
MRHIHGTFRERRLDHAVPLRNLKCALVMARIPQRQLSVPLNVVVISFAVI